MLLDLLDPLANFNQQVNAILIAFLNLATLRFSVLREKNHLKLFHPLRAKILSF